MEDINKNIKKLKGIEKLKRKNFRKITEQSLNEQETGTKINQKRVKKNKCNIIEISSILTIQN